MRTRSAVTARPPARPPALRVWTWCLGRWGTRPTASGQAFRVDVDVLVLVLARSQGVRWPSRTTGGWWWTSRWRLEWLLGWNEWASAAWVSRLVPVGCTVSDSRAHLGYYSRVAARAVGAAGRVLAVEPYPENVQVLRHNARGPVEVVVAALGAEPGRAPLHEAAGSSNHSLRAGYADTGGTLVVDVTTVDDLVGEQRLSRVDLVKLDLEGREVEALLGMRRTASRFRPVLLVEHAPGALHAAGRTSTELMDVLTDLGYVAFDVTDVYEHKHLPERERRRLRRWLGRRGYAVVEGPDDSLAVPRRQLLGLVRG